MNQYYHFPTNIIADVLIHHIVLSFSNLIADIGVPTCWQAESFLAYTLSTVSIVLFYLYSILPLLFLYSSLLFNLFSYTLGPEPAFRRLGLGELLGGSSSHMGKLLMARFAPMALSLEGTDCSSKDLQ